MSVRGESCQLPEEVLVLPRVFECVVMGHPASPAVKDAATHHSWTTYHNLNQSANKLARCILKRLVNTECYNPDGDRVVAVCMTPSSQLVTALLAIHKAGAAYLPLDVTFPESRVAHILQDARPALLLVQGEPAALQGAHTSPQLENKVPILHLEDLHSEVEEERGDDLSVGEVGASVSGSSIATILYTSGSTGVPKGVRLSHRAIFNRLSWQWKTFPYQTQEVCCFKTALTFVDSISEIFGPLLTGHQVVVVPKSITDDVEQMVEVLQQEKIGRLVLVPSLLRSILLHCASAATHSPSLQHLRLWVCSGEVFPRDLLHSFFNTFTHGQTICNFYGSTEVMGDVTYLELCNIDDAVTKLVDDKVPIGYPIRNCCIYLLNSVGEAVLEGQVGEVCAAGLSLASGYVGAALQQKFIPNKFSKDPDYSVLYRTGDFGRIVDGVVVYEGRTDSQIKIRGHRVDMNEVELAMLKVDNVDKVHVMCYRPGEVNQALVGFYTSTRSNSSSNNSQDDKLVPEKLGQKLSLLLQPYMIPQLIQIDELPLLVNGKVDRQQLLKIYEQRQDESEVEVDVSGVSEEERSVARTLLLTVARVLGPQVARSEHLSLNTSFFDIGGNSLNSVMVVTSLIDLGYSIGIGQFMKAKTLGEVASQLQKASLQEENIGDMCKPADDTDQYTCHMLDYHHKEAVISLISESFSRKGDLEMWLHTQPSDYVGMLNALYDHLVHKQLSFVLRRKGSEALVACSLNLDLRDEPPIHDVSPKLECILTFLDHCEEPAKSELPEEVGAVLHAFVMGTLYNLTPLENVNLIQKMEKENLKLAREKGFKAVFTTNTSSLTQQICEDILRYHVLHNYQVNLYVAPDGSKPFGAAPASQHAVAAVKFI
ncbi:hypothetical protein OTU49_002633 [Cherax quadricarinatus]|uniref:Carrier domain-containing protein n=1 Tax=Cherax quadricarinatus TaxID=27406 RepID=A0AAW0XMH5_CHEQU